MGTETFCAQSGSVSLTNSTRTQTITLGSSYAVSKQIRIFFEGNGASAYFVNSATLTQGGKTATVLVNGLSSFYIPAMGRWSDYVSISEFTIPSTCALTVNVKFNIPMIVPIINGELTGTGTVGVATSTGGSTDIVAGKCVLCLNFNGTNGATSWTEEAQGLTPYYENGSVLSTAEKKFGVSSLYGHDWPGNTWCDYNPGSSWVSSDFTMHGWTLTKEVGVMPEYASYAIVIDGGVGAVAVRVFCYQGDSSVSVAGSGLVNFPFPSHDVWHHHAIIRSGTNLLYALDGIILAVFDATGIVSSRWIDLHVGGGGGTLDMWWDAWEIVTYAKWTTNFTPPTTPPPSDPILHTTVTSTETISITDNTLIAAGDTITIIGS